MFLHDADLPESLRTLLVLQPCIMKDALHVVAKSPMQDASRNVFYVQHVFNFQQSLHVVAESPNGYLSNVVALGFVGSILFPLTTALNVLKDLGNSITVAHPTFNESWVGSKHYIVSVSL